MNLSIIIPLRKNSPWIGETLYSIWKQAAEPEKFEVLLGVAHDDTKTKESYSNVKLIRLDQRMRKFGVGFYTNRLALEAKGKLLWWLSDECIIKTKDFDLKLNKEADEVGDKIFQLTSSGDEGGGAAYCILTKKWIEVTGRWADTPSIDSWVNTICSKLPNRSKHLGWLKMEDRRVTGKITDEESFAQYLPPEVDFDINEYSWGGQSVMSRVEEDTQKLLKSIREDNL